MTARHGLRIGVLALVAGVLSGAPVRAEERRAEGPALALTGFGVYLIRKPGDRSES